MAKNKNTGKNPNKNNTGADSGVIEGKADEVKKKKKSVSPFEFFQQVRNETAKVTWTTRNETMVSTIMVLIMVAVMAAFFFMVDWGLRTAVCSVLPIDCVSRDIN